VFQFTSNGKFMALHVFGSAADDGTEPIGALIKGANKELYGTTYMGGSGTHGEGTVFKLQF
jgi:uncharacterized repeat protein (TIGR03803 family)